MVGLQQAGAPSRVVLLERDGTFFAYEPNLGIIASDSTVDGAYKRFIGARRALAEDARRAGLTIRPSAARVWSPARPGRGGGGQRSALAELSLFLAKIFIVLLVLGAFGAAIAVTAGHVASNVKPLAMSDIADKAADVARDISSLSPEKKELLRQSVGIVSRELAPVADAWRNPPPR